MYKLSQIFKGHKDLCLPDEPTTTEMQAILDYVFAKADPYVTFRNNGPFIMALGMAFVISPEGDKYVGPTRDLPQPIVQLTDDNVDDVLDSLGYAQNETPSYTVN